MFISSWFTAAVADAHRQDLIARADRHRLAELARSAQRAARAGTRVTPPPPTPPRVVRSVPDAGVRNVEADRRYAVPR
ncbi:hypothetical protein [Pseudonocardia sp.]|jgi:hypothetical protein|uniref:hypothetical protein n=1 Tax=Pseudonocardia sp. TaxID=60912 RepID=UPI002613EC34|nr:hypothetical protein [Pseudonocardia sp.]